MAVLSETEERLSQRLLRVARMQRTAQGAALAELGLHPGQDLCLSALLPRAGHPDGMAPGELARVLGVRAPTVTKTLNRLTAQGLVMRRPSRLDGRMMLVVLTDEGLARAERLKSLWKREDKRMLSGLEAKDRKRLAKLLDAIEVNLDGPKPL